MYNLQPIKKDYLRINALIVVLFLYQYGLLLPFAVVISIQYAIILFTVLIFAFLIATKRIKVTTNSVLLIVTPLTFLILKTPFEYPSFTPESNIIHQHLLSFLSIGLSGILVGSLQFSNTSFLCYGYKVAWINFLLLFIFPFTSYYGTTDVTINYMRFGYAILPSVIFSFLFVIKSKKKYFAIILFIGSFIEMLVFGARGASFTFLLFVVLYFLLPTGISIRKRLLFIILTLPLLIFLPYIAEAIIKLSDHLNISSYTINKFTRMLEGETIQEVSSGRDFIYKTAIDRIEKFPLFGSPFNSAYKDLGIDYYHNFFLDLIVNFGIPIFLIMTFVYLYFLINIFRFGAESIRIVALILISISLGRLLVSSDIWSRPEFWLMMGYIINFNKKKTLCAYPTTKTAY